jgi:hypothetical protein
MGQEKWIDGPIYGGCKRIIQSNFLQGELDESRGEIPFNPHRGQKWVEG